MRVIQYSRDFSAYAETPQRTGYPAFAGYDEGEKCEAAFAVEALDPGVPYESRWAPYVRIHGPGQGQFPKGSIRPRGYMAPDARHSLARSNVAMKWRRRQRRDDAEVRDSLLSDLIFKHPPSSFRGAPLGANPKSMLTIWLPGWRASFSRAFASIASAPNVVTIGRTSLLFGARWPDQSTCYGKRNRVIFARTP